MAFAALGETQLVRPIAACCAKRINRFPGVFGQKCLASANRLVDQGVGAEIPVVSLVGYIPNAGK